MAEVEDTLVDVHVSPVGTATLCYAELADDIELLGVRVDKSYEAATLVVDEELVIGGDDGTLAGTTRPFLFVVGLACFPIDAAPCTFVVVNPVGTVDFAAYEDIASVVSVEGFGAPCEGDGLEVIGELDLEAVDVVAVAEEDFAVLIEG